MNNLGIAIDQIKRLHLRSVVFTLLKPLYLKYDTICDVIVNDSHFKFDNKN